MELKELAPWHWTRSALPGRYPGRHALESLHRDMDRMFEDFWRGMDRPFGQAVSGFGANMPAIDQSEDDKACYIAVELPGVDEKDVDVSLADNVLTISGERKSEKEEKEKNYYLKECSYGSFRRSITLPAEVDDKKIKATFDKGVLKITLPKSTAAQKKAKRIAISAK